MCNLISSFKFRKKSQYLYLSETLLFSQGLVTLFTRRLTLELNLLLPVHFLFLHRPLNCWPAFKSGKRKILCDGNSSQPASNEPFLNHLNPFPATLNGCRTILNRFKPLLNRSSDIAENNAVKAQNNYCPLKENSTER